ncbi:MAG TPA: creatininase family protein [bacterium]|nr:creatininase family protein [bacterium]
MAKTNVAKMVWQEAKEFAERNAVVLVPLGNVEPSGRHSVMGGEIFIADYVADGVAAKTGSFRLPTLPFGYCPTFMGFPGTVTLQAATLEAILYDICHSLVRHGFDHICIVDNHSGNEGVIEQAARRVKADHGVLLANMLLPPIMRAVSKDLYPDLAAVHGHGGEPGVSARLYLCPEDMRLDLAASAGETRGSYHGLPVSNTTVKHGGASWTLYLDFGDTNPTGGTGDASQASAARGKVILDRMVDFGAEVIEQFRTIPTRLPAAR